MARTPLYSRRRISISDSSASPITLCPPDFTKEIHEIPEIKEISFDTDDSFSSKKRKRSPIKKSYAQNLFEGVEDLLVSYARYANTPEPVSKMQRIEADMEVFHNTPKSTSRPYISQIEIQERRMAYLKEQRDYDIKVLHRSVTPNRILTPKSSNISGILPLESPSTPLYSPIPFKYQEIPESIKKTILLGVTCFVDVRAGKENRSNCVKKELESLGAKCERSLTQKVDIVVFKEGLVHNYFKAKQLGISMVSTFWIEACKEAQKKVDATLYPPPKIEKYEDILPYEAIKKRRFRIPKHFKETYGISSLSAGIISRKKLKTATDTKRSTTKKAASEDSSKNKICTKKLNFDANETIDNKENIEKSFDIDCSFSNFSLKELPSSVTKETNLQTDEKLNDNNTPKENGNLLNSFIDLTEDTPEQVKIDEVTDEIQNDIKTKQKIKRPLYTNSSYIDTGSSEIPTPIFRPLFVETNSQKSSTKSKKNGIKSHRIKPKSIIDDFQKEINEGRVARDSISCFVTSKKLSFKSQPPTIVFTSLRENEISECEKIIQKLGVFEIESNVSKRTTHVVSNGPRRTINLLKGLARGCWILDIKWLYKSDTAGTYVLEDQFELTSFSSAVVQNRLERNAFKDDYHMDLFSSCGPIYVSQQSVPPNEDLTELIKLCEGKIVTNSSVAKIIIGGHRKNNSSAFRVKESWILDSITQNKLLDINDFKY